MISCKIIRFCSWKKDFVTFHTVTFRPLAVLIFWVLAVTKIKSGIFFQDFEKKTKKHWALRNSISEAHCPPQTILGKQGALQNFFGEILGMNFCSSNALLKLKNNALFTRQNLFCDFFMWFFLWFCKSVLVKMLPQNIQFLKILKSLVF